MSSARPPTAGNTDGVLMEISTVDGSVSRPPAMAARCTILQLDHDRRALPLIAGESRSFTTGGSRRPDDAILLTYDSRFGPVIRPAIH